MPHKTVNSYPALKEETGLPFFLCAVGCYEYQPIDNKPNGDILHQIFIVEEGELELQLEHTSYLIQKGMGFFLHNNVPYCIKKKTNLCTTYFIIWGCHCESMLFPAIHFNNYVIFPSLDIEKLKVKLKKMYLLSTETTFYSKCQNSALVYDYLIDIYAQNEKHKEENSSGGENPALLLAKRYIEQYYFSDLSLDTLAEVSHVSPQHLCRLFQKHMKIRPTHYINLIRIKIAKRLLQQTDKTITEISEKVGFNTPYYFTNTFKKLEGLSPSAYRKMMRS